MRTARFTKDVLRPICYLLGLDPTTSDLGDFAAAKIFAAIDARAKEGWDKLEDPAETIMEERAFRQVWYDSLAYTAGTEVFNPTDELYYRALVNTVAGDLPTDGTKFEPILDGDLDKYVETEQYAKQAMGDVLGVWTENPRISSSARKIDFQPGPTGIDIANWAGPTVWVEFLARPSEFGDTVYDAGATYSTSDLVYNPADGECYVSLADSNSGRALSDETYWLWQPMPYAIAGYVKYCAASDCTDDSQDKQNWREEAEAALGDAFDRLGAQGRKTTYRRFRHGHRSCGRNLIGNLPVGAFAIALLLAVTAKGQAPLISETDPHGRPVQAPSPPAHTHYVTTDDSGNAAVAGNFTVSGSLVPHTSAGTAAFAVDDSGQSTITIADGATATPFGSANNFSGMFLINGTVGTGTCGLFITGGGAIAKISDSSGVTTTTQGTSSKLNVYLSGGSAVTIENKLGTSVTLRVVAFRTRGSQ